MTKRFIPSKSVLEYSVLAAKALQKLRILRDKKEPIIRNDTEKNDTEVGLTKIKPKIVEILTIKCSVYSWRIYKASLRKIKSEIAEIL